MCMPLLGGEPRAAPSMGLDLQELPSEVTAQTTARESLQSVHLSPFLFQPNADIKVCIMLRQETPYRQSYLRTF